MIPSCSRCASFRSDPAEMERAFPGLASLGSGHGSVRAGDGMCDRHGLYLPGSAACADFEAGEASTAR